MLKGTLNSSYRNKKGNKIFTYVVTGTVSELAAYRAAKGEYNVDNDKGLPLFFLPEKDMDGTIRLLEPSIDLLITTNNNVVIDDTKAIAAHDALVRAESVAAEARVRAELRVYGNRNAVARVAAPATPTPTPEALPTPAELIAKGETQPEGQETLND